MTDDEIQALWDEACKDSPQNPGWNRHIRFARALLSKLRAQVADEHCSACNPQVFSVEQLEKDPLLVARLWRKPAGTDGSLVERILEHVSEYGESMASSSLLSVRTIARRNLEARIEAELADAMRSQDESPLREALSEIASAWSARTRLPEEDGIQALKDIARAALASAPVAGEQPIKLSDDVLHFLKEGVENATQCEEADVDHEFADQLLLLMHTPLYTGPRPKQRKVDWGPLVVAPVAGEARPSDAEVLKVYAETVAEYADGRGFEAGTVAFARSLLRRYAAPQASVVAGERHGDSHVGLEAPVAGEAVTWEAVRQELAIFLMGATGRSSKEWHRPLDNASEGGALARMRACLAAPQASPSDDKLWDQTLTERDEYHDMADKLANAIADHLLIEIGEHSSSNCPWMRALEAIENAAPQASAEYERGHADGWAAGWDQAIKQPQADKEGGQQRAGDVSAEAHKAALLEVERVGIELAARLHEAAMSLETISQIAGRPGKDMETMDDVRGYAHSRARAARAALSAPQAEQGERDA